MVLICSWGVVWHAVPTSGRFTLQICDADPTLPRRTVGRGEATARFVCAVRIDLQGIIWKAKLCMSFCMLRIISSFMITISILALNPRHEKGFSPQVSLKLWGVLPSTVQQVSGGPQASSVTQSGHSSPPAQCQSKTKAGLFSARAEVLLLRPLAAVIFKHKCCSWELDLPITFLRRFKCLFIHLHCRDCQDLVLRWGQQAVRYEK